MDDAAERHDADGPLREGATINGRYLVGRVIGEGGFGAVYEATHLHTGRRVAVKALHLHLLGHAQSRQRFLREARAATRVEHENVVDVIDLDVDAATGVPFLVQELLLGESLLERLERQPGQRMPPREALRLLQPVMEALSAAHAAGVVHRDLKPNNIFITRDRHGHDVPKVIDFGIAKVFEESADAARTATGVLLGTPTHMSPEQALGRPPYDAQTDVWAMGVVLYECLSGRLPYEAENVQQVLGMIQFRDPVPLDARDPALPPDVVAAVHRALQRDRGARFASMAQLLDALRATATFAASAVEPAATADADTAPAPLRVAAVSPASLEGARTWTDRPRPAPRPSWRWGVALAASLVVLAVAAVASRRAPARAAVRAQVAPASAPAPPVAAPSQPVAAPSQPIAAPSVPVPPPLAPPAPARPRHVVARRVAPIADAARAPETLEPEVQWHP